jgi:hypothetical protein
MNKINIASILACALSFSSLAMEYEMQGLRNRVDTYSMVDDCDITDAILIPLSQADTLHLFLLEMTEAQLQAAWPEHEELIRPMLDQTWRNSQNNWIEAPFVHAAKKGLLTFISHVMSSPEVEPNQKVLDQALHGAALYGHIDVVRFLLLHGANPNGYVMTKTVGITTLEAALVDIYGRAKGVPNLELIEELIRHGATQTLALCDSAAEKWRECLVLRPGLRTFYKHTMVFGTHLLSLEQTCILHVAEHDFSVQPLLRMFNDLLIKMLLVRQLVFWDPLLKFDNHH